MQVFLENLVKHNIRQTMLLKIYTEDPDLKLEYMRAILEHHDKIVKDLHFPDVGFDLYCPEEVIDEDDGRIKIDLKIKCCAKLLTLDSRHSREWGGHFTGFDLVARSSMSKTPLRMANQIGIIDSGYNGNLCVVLDNLMAYENISEYSCGEWYDYMHDENNNNRLIKKHQKLVQICSPTRCPIWVVLVESEQELENATSNRGKGGFGSTTTTL